MIEKTIIDYLNQELPVAVFLERPKNPPNKYVIFEKTGSSKLNHLVTATFAFQSYAPTMLEAAELNEEVKAAVESMTVLDTICSARLDSDYNFTYTAMKDYRYQAVFDITHY